VSRREAHLGEHRRRCPADRLNLVRGAGDLGFIIATGLSLSGSATTYVFIAPVARVTRTILPCMLPIPFQQS
jgi:hypothetical protein